MNDYVSPVGQGIPRLETRDKITGKAVYADDLSRPDMLIGVIVPSPYAHARIAGYDVSAALALDGVAAVVTGEDVGDHKIGPFIKDETALAVGKVRYMGEPVAAVAAVDLETARKAARLIDISYEELPAVFDTDAATADDAPVLHEDLGGYIKVFEAENDRNAMAIIEIVEGDVASAWDRCAAVVEGSYETQAQCHSYMEPCSALAEIDSNGKITIWSSN